jgi:predicted metal-dependent hydrolase
MTRSKPQSDATLRLALGRKTIAVRVRNSTRARRMRLQVDPTEDWPELIVPRRVSLHAAQRFLEEHLEWLADRVAALPPRVPFTDGAVVPLLGVEHRIRRVDSRSRKNGTVVACRDLFSPRAEIRVAAPPRALSEDMHRWLRQQARHEFAVRSRRYAKRLGREVTGVRVNDPKRQWGSCSSAGRLSFSWRLVMAPPKVIDYVAAHEVAHLVHRHHGRTFWAMVDRLIGDEEKVA